MISGAGLADAALLLVDGSPGGFEAGFYGVGAAAGGAAAGFGGLGPDAPPGGQTQEHAQLARSLGVEQLVVVISKLDTCDYSQVSLIEHQLSFCMDGMCPSRVALCVSCFALRECCQSLMLSLVYDAQDDQQLSHTVCAGLHH
jgi:hypothetical protein